MQSLSLSKEAYTYAISILMLNKLVDIFILTSEKLLTQTQSLGLLFTNKKAVSKNLDAKSEWAN